MSNIIITKEGQMIKLKPITDIDKDEICHLYYSGKDTVKQLADAYRVSYSTIYNILKKWPLNNAKNLQP